jgi:integrase
MAEIAPLRPFGRSKRYSLQTLRDKLGKVSLKGLTSQRVIEYAKQRHSEGAGAVTVQAELSYLGGMLRIARAVWRYDLHQDIIPDAQEALKLLGLVGKSKPRDRRPTTKELERLSDYFGQVYDRWSVPMDDMMWFLIGSAMRISEACSVQWDDLNEADRTVLIRNRKHPTEKLGNDQVVPLLGDTWNIVQRQPRSAPRVFPYNSRTVGTYWRRACKALEISDLRLHDLRHEGVSRLFEQGYQIQEVAMVSGHRDWQQLKRYTQLRPSDLHRDREN